MKRKFLEDFGLEKEVIDKIMTENGNDVNLTKGDLETLRQQLEAANQQVQERDGQLEQLKNATGDVEAMKQQIITLQAENLTAKEKHEADMKELKLSTAIKMALGDNAQDADLVSGLFDKSKLLLSDDGKITGLEEQLKALKKEKAFLFKEEKAPQQQIKGVPTPKS